MNVVVSKALGGYYGGGDRKEKEDLDSITVSTTETAATKKVTNVTEHGRKMAEEHDKPYRSLEEFVARELGPASIAHIRASLSVAGDFVRVARASVRNLSALDDDAIAAAIVDLGNRGTPNDTDATSNLMADPIMTDSDGPSLGSQGVMGSADLHMNGQELHEAPTNAVPGDISLSITRSSLSSLDTEKGASVKKRKRKSKNENAGGNDDIDEDREAKSKRRQQ